MNALALLESPRQMSADEARRLTDQIRETSDRLWRDLHDAYVGRAWVALGYSTFRDYTKAEFGMAKSQAYRLLDQARVIKALAEAADSPIGETVVNELTARTLKPVLHVVEDDVRGRVQRGEDPHHAIQDAVEAARRKYAGSLKRVDRRGNRIVENIVSSAGDIVPSIELIDYESLDPVCIGAWVDELNEAAKRIRQFARKLQAALVFRERLERAAIREKEG